MGAIPTKKVFLVTGTSRGLGKAIAGGLLSRGHKVFGVSRSESDLCGDGYTHLAADVTDETAVRHAMSEVAETADRLDVLIHGAGHKTNRYALLTSAEQAQETLSTNLLGGFLVVREAVKLMKRNRFGRVIFLSSVAIPLGEVGTAIYSASKAGMLQFQHVIAREHAEDDVTFNSIGISIYEDSEMVGSLNAKERATLDGKLLKPNPLDTEEVLHAVDFFVAETAQKITNQIIYFGGVR